MSTLNRLEKPFHVNFEITNSCNFNCSFCSAQLSKYQKPDLSTQDVCNIISILADEGVYALFFTGGEPLLRDDLPIFVKQALDYGMNVCISSNAAVASKEKAKQLVDAGLDEIQVSIQAPDTTHDNIVGVDGAIKMAFNGLQNLIDVGLGVIVASVGTRKNYQTLPSLADKVAHLGGICYRVLRLIPTSKDALQDMIPYEGLEWLVTEMINRIEKGKITIDIHTPPGFVSHGYHNPGEYPQLLHAFTGICTAGKTTMAILPNGDCIPCIEFKNFMCGNILKQSLDEIWNAEPMKLLKNVTPDKYQGICGECSYKWTCYSARCIAYRFDHLYGDDFSCYKVRRQRKLE